MSITQSTMIPKRLVNMKENLTGRSIRGGGAHTGTSKSPCSQSGMDPCLVRGQSSQLNFEMIASEKQIESISKSFKKLRDIRFGRAGSGQIYAAYKVSQDFNKPCLSAQRMVQTRQSSPNNPIASARQ